MTRRAKYTEHSGSIADAISSTHGDIQSLAEEVREIVDNASGTNLEQTQRIQTFSETADTLENLDELSAPDWMDHQTVQWRVETKPRRTGRAARCDAALDPMRVAKERLEELSGDETLTEEQRSEAQELSDEMDSYISDAEGAEFPGMYG
jgi:hypothetical protein